MLACMVIGEVILYVSGLTGLWSYFQSTGEVSVLKVLNAGLFPFLIGDALKAGAAVALFPYFWKGSEKLKK